MKKSYVLAILVFHLILSVHAQSHYYSVPVEVHDLYGRDSVHIIGRLDLDFPEEGTVIIQFDGQAYGTDGDRIYLACNDQPKWTNNDGHVSILMTPTGEGRCFSHMRSKLVSAGHHSFYAVVQGGKSNGNATTSVYGNLAVEFIPLTSTVLSDFTTTVSPSDATHPVAMDSISIEASGPGVIVGY